MSRVLVIDDDRAILDLVKTLVGRRAFTIDAANDGTDAWTLIAENAYDEVLLDLMMPNMNGFDLVDRVRRDKPALLPRIVVMTASRAAGCCRWWKACTPSSASHSTPANCSSTSAVVGGNE